MMTRPLVLDSLEIHRFRVFRHLQIDRLKQVNLIVGKNNVGKTCLLEALLLYANRGSLLTMRMVLESRDEAKRLLTSSEGDAKGRSIRYLFHGRGDLEDQHEPVQIGPIGSPPDMLSIGLIWFRQQLDQHGRQQWQRIPPEDYDAGGLLLPGLSIALGAQPVLSYPLHIDIPDLDRVVQLKKPRQISSIFVPANGLGREQVNLLWDKIALTDLERDVLASLHIIASEVERVNLVGSQEGDRERIPMAKITDFDDPLPLRSLGEGMNRLFGVVLALVNARDGMLLIDEIDSGLHYSAQPDLWRLIFQVARRLNVQVFATTHSWDCVQAFQQAAQEDGQGDGLLISLRERKDQKGQGVAVLFDERELGIVTREQIEVR